MIVTRCKWNPVSLETKIQISTLLQRFLWLIRNASHIRLPGKALSSYSAHFMINNVKWEMFSVLLSYYWGASYVQIS